jgi:drug/metabolite transporter (DMT)-like permease
MQRITSPTHTALIFCMEPVFAALYAYVTIDERLGLKGLIGAILIFGGMLLSQVSMPDKLYQIMHQNPGENREKNIT